MSITADNQVPTQTTSGQTTDTSHVEVPAVPVLGHHGAPIADPGEALRNPYAAELNRLHSFLMTRFPRQMNRSNTQLPESPVDAAIRLLSGLGTAGTGIVRCPEQYCNLPKDHDGDHGFVTYTPR